MALTSFPCLKLSNDILFAFSIKSLTCFKRFSVIKHLLTPLIYLVLLPPTHAGPQHTDLPIPQTCQACRSAQMLTLYMTTSSSSSTFQLKYHALTIQSRVASRSLTIVSLDFIFLQGAWCYHTIFSLFLCLLFWKVYENRHEVCLAHHCVLGAQNRVWHMENIQQILVELMQFFRIDPMLPWFSFFYIVTSAAIIFNLIIICMSFAFKFLILPCCLKKNLKYIILINTWNFKRKEKSHFSFINKSKYEFKK